MTEGTLNNWQAVQAEVLQRIRRRIWKPGDLIPNEADLAQEFGCARATVNRALRALAGSGLLDRRRRAGTRVAIYPVRKATLDIPVIRHEIEGKGQRYGYSLLSQLRKIPPSPVYARMKLSNKAKLMHLKALHLADGKPYLFEDRWINIAAVRAVTKVDLSQQSANEWLVENAPFTSGDIAFTAEAADVETAEILHCSEGEAIFVIERSTWSNSMAITFVRLLFVPGYRMQTEI